MVRIPAARDRTNYTLLAETKPIQLTPYARLAPTQIHLLATNDPTYALRALLGCTARVSRRVMHRSILSTSMVDGKRSRMHWMLRPGPACVTSCHVHAAGRSTGDTANSEQRCVLLLQGGEGPVDNGRVLSLILTA